MEEAAICDGNWSFADANWDEVSVEAKDMVRRLLSLLPHKRPSASEALDLLYNPNPNPNPSPNPNPNPNP